MPSMLAAPVHQPQAKLSDRQLTLGPMALSGGQATVNRTDGDWILPLIGRAIDRVMQRKEAAITMAVDQGQLSRQLSGAGHLSVRKLGLLPEDFWRALIDELRAHFGLDDDAARLDRALDALGASVKVIAEIARKGLR